MSRTATVSLDGSPESITAADWAAREALLRGLPLRLLHAWQWQPHACAPPAGVTLPPTGSDSQREWADRMLREAETRLAQCHPGLRITVDRIAEQPVPPCWPAPGTPSCWCWALAPDRTHGFLIGSVAYSVVSRTERPVVLVRAGERTEDEHVPDSSGVGSMVTAYRDVVLGLDLSGPADSVIEFAFDAAARRAADLRVVHGWSLQPHYYGYDGALDPELDAQVAARIRAELTELLRPWQDK
ncbi:universal stress protein [Streptomyces chartreusis]|uniref:universal stress protein n=1 Tax=Streptomyces chartreusis TaxID=1969 RepID=UPI0036D7C9E1